MRISLLQTFAILFLLSALSLPGCPSSDTPPTDGDNETIDGDTSEKDVDTTDIPNDGDSDIEPDIETETETDTDEDISTDKPQISVQSELEIGPGIMNVLVSSALNVQNIGTAELLIDNITLSSDCSKEFSIITDFANKIAVAAGSSTSIIIGYTMIDSGADTCEMSIHSNDPVQSFANVQITTKYYGNPTLHVYPEILEFDKHDIYSTEPTEGMIRLTHVIKPDSEDVLYLHSFKLENENTPFFISETFDTNEPVYLEPGRNIDVPIMFKPEAAGSYTNTFSFISNDTSYTDGKVTVDLMGDGVFAQMVPSSSEIDFMLKPIGHKDSITLTVTNEGETKAYIESIGFVTNKADSEFEFETNWIEGTAVKPSTSINITISYTPIDEGEDTATLRITGTNFYQNNQLDIPISGEGKSPEWSLSESSLLFNETIVFETEQKTFTISNTKTTNLIIQQLQLTGDSEFSILDTDITQLPATITPGNSFTVHVNFAPTTRAAKLGNIHVVTDDELLPALDVSLSGTAKAPLLTITDATGNAFNKNVYFDKTRIGETKTIKAILKNDGNTNLLINNTVLTPEGTVHFSSALNITTIAAGESTELNLSYHPQLPISTNTSTFTFTTNDPDMLSVELNLSGFSINPKIAITPVTTASEPFDFGEKTINPETPYGPRSFVITNTGEGPLTISKIDFSGIATGGFEIAFPNSAPPFDVNSESEGNESLTFNVYFNPVTAKDYFATIAVDSNDFNIPVLSAHIVGVGSKCPPGFHGEDCSYECELSSGGIEICDGLDNDCDESTDEDYPIGTNCDGVGECGLGVIECHPDDPQFTICSSDIGGSEYDDDIIGGKAEICDHKDNDCDGTTDNGFDINAVCTPPGECSAGVMECHRTDATKSICSTGPEGSMYSGSDELCDNLDNDCDGQTDEIFQVGLECEGVGECGSGTFECNPNNPNLTICSTDIGGSQYPVEAPVELCNNLDDDCDGLTDEELHLGEVCQPEGECREGIIQCNTEDAALPVCSTGPGGAEYDGIDEICDGKDNDCDGETDEDFNIGQTCEGLGECGEGTYECDPEDTSKAICSTDIGGSQYPETAPTELCNNLDDNCDGSTDEGFSIGSICTGKGECGEGIYECNPLNNSQAICSTENGGSAYQGTDEICDGKDNDCDGSYDEDWQNLGERCDAGGTCGGGYVECNQHVSTSCTEDTYCSKDPTCGSQRDPSDEICNGLDDDCNGQTDEVFNVGSECTSLGECGAGVFECSPFDPTKTICSTSPEGSAYAGSIEICDGLDNDCDGETDEDFNIGQPCTAEGECGAGVYECSPSILGIVVCSTGPDGSQSKSASETCDEKDNDCDGKTDEDFNIGSPCNGVGACGVGVFECSQPDSSICSTDLGGSQYQGTTEKCDNSDNDCDGETDEDFNIGESCDGIGECGAGTLQCRPGHTDETICSTDIEGSNPENQNELCDSKDNDCDGETDEDFSVGTVCDGVGACGQGIKECDPNNNTKSICSSDINGSSYPNNPEICNSLDDDCDGQTDEDFELGVFCSGTGICGDGVTECNSEGTVQCSTHANGSQWAGHEELCNGLDDDCDTRTDEDFDIGGLCSGLGVCSDGILECDSNNSSRAICSTSFGGSNWGGSNEICNNLDDDCDGVKDNGFNIGQFCNGTGECGEGVYECHPTDQSKSICSTEPGGSNPGDSNDICDNKDNNCDGITDNGFNTGEACTSPGECGAGVLECADQMSTRCSTGPSGSNDQSSTEICDGKDNDCDGLTDEDFDLGGACEGTGVCGLGLYECTATGEVICSTEPGGSDYNQTGEELCNNRDDDCDGLTDEGLGLGESCVGLGECSDDEGVTQCSKFGEVICSTSFNGNNYAGTEESCNDKDDNCNGLTDEDFGIGEDCYGTGECSAFRGTLICKTSSSAICSVDSPWHEDYLGIDELCNELDDNCNGFTDETFSLVGNSCSGTGACNDGVYICNPYNRTQFMCSTDIGGPDYTGSSEICDNIDNDCDGLTDEDFDIDGRCNGSGGCSDSIGSLICNTTTTTICTTDIESHEDYAGVAETCDYVDNDCDGLTDEDFTTLGDSCTVEGAGCGTGFIECNLNISGLCPNTTYCSKDVQCGSQGGDTPYEVCNGIDDDCDSCTDEGLTRTTDTCEPITCNGIGECSDGVLECSTFSNTMCSTAIGGSAYDGSNEICDGKDNDCDGLTDEDFLVGHQCEGIGSCGPGLLECDPNDNTKSICSTNPGGSADESLEVESCNKLDDDCDGFTDEDFEVGKSCIGMGICGPGVIECNGIGGTRCSTEYTGSEYEGTGEDCNDLDDDCDGYTDEDFGIVDPITEEFISIYDTETGQRSQCLGNGTCDYGYMECLNEATAICCSSIGGSCYDTPTETCDGVDNDCNDVIDDPWADILGQPCNGEGACGTGTWECREDQSGVICSTATGGSEAHGTNELCDGIDNDCDGYTDETFTVGNDYPCVGVGECGPGYFECDPTDENKRQIICSTDIGGSMYNNPAYPNIGGKPETCDGKDNDCDGATDNGFHIGEFCQGIGECRIGVYECETSTSYRCSTNPGGTQFDGSTEICDNKDNDCDGLTDEDFNIGDSFPCTAPSGCGTGVMECATDNSTICSTAPGGSEYGGTEELCNSQDDDCDFAIDEDWEIGDPCCTVTGECGECGGPGRAGTWECASSTTRRCSVAYHGSISQSELEKCDGKDNDCDGMTDEIFDVGDPCVGVGACGSGVYECNANEERYCSSNPGGSHDKSSPEQCDGIDNDCDGFTDEGFVYNVIESDCTSDSNCQSGYSCDVLSGDCISDAITTCSGTGECGQGVLECLTSETTKCSTSSGGTEYDPQQELCDGLDNDCDGQTDEDFFTTETCDGAGECGEGTWVCIDVSTAVCSTEIPASPDYGGSAEICDGLDNDCDGQTDDGMNVGDPCEGIGECGTGVTECAADGSIICSTSPSGSSPQSVAELCDNLDNDCDGETDEDFSLGEVCNGAGDCGDGFYECDCPAGQQFCDTDHARCSTDAGGSEYSAGSEICDLRDNDCDGLTDEDWNIGASCVGIGLCGLTAIGETRYGSIECKFGEAATRCSTDKGGSEYAGRAELCNMIDDDCDNSTDEDYSIGNPCEGIGECGLGVFECRTETSHQCSTDQGGTQSQAIVELCNNRDDDCDGSTDEDFSSLGLTCTGSGTCGAGVYECKNDTEIICSTSEGGSAFEGQPERCNGLDDDCDGQTDEDFRCDTSIDPDCNDKAYLAEVCDGVGECGSGYYVCSTDYALQCNTDIGGIFYQGIDEACNGLDDDCDGATDEDFSLGEVCSGTGECRNFEGVWECNPLFGESGEETVCSTDPNGSDPRDTIELCNGLDDDCDGFTDEGFKCFPQFDPECNDEVYMGTECVGEGGCGGNGHLECNADGTGLICSTSPGGSQYEQTAETLCDGLDNNCNGFTDEGFIYVIIEGTCTNDTDCDEGFSCDTLSGDCIANSASACEGLGECTAGTIECNPANNTTTICSTELGGSESQAVYDICDGKDNDCDGQTDEFYTTLGQVCEGRGSCGQGFIECKGNYSVGCSTDIGGSEYTGAETSYPGTKAEPLCDGMDDDCDGLTDEGFNIGEYCEGLGVCSIGLFECDPENPNKTRCSSEANGTDERCDNLDNDCDGVTDENFTCDTSTDPTCSNPPFGSAYIDMACVAEGVCGTGTGECNSSGSGTRCSTEPGASQSQASVEICDGLDNDCDGQTDEGFSLGISCNGVGACSNGITECADNHQGIRCSTNPGGSEYVETLELCNGIDDDCDGEVDEDYKYNNNLWPYCQGESCGLPIGFVCEGTGECGMGSWECADDGERTRCSSNGYNDGRGNGSQYNPLSEKCDNKDNDCDGSTDEDFPIGNSCDGTGACGTGILECATLTTTRCSTEPGGSQDQSHFEICDDLDNDCDGQTNENFLVGVACNGVGECSTGIMECSGPFLSICSTDIGGSQYSGSPELCDDKDNDCDGLTDEAWPKKGDYCTLGSCGTGTYECKEDQSGIVCVGETTATDEICNGLDDDCDGATDEDFGVGFGCIGVGMCGPGTYECDLSDENRLTTICSVDIGGSEYAGTAEECDYLDNDCDGLTDEDFKAGGTGAYNTLNHCGACKSRCELDNTITECTSEGICTMTGCDPNYADINQDSSDGCECHNEYPVGAVCGEAEQLPDYELSDEANGDITTAYGQITGIEDEMWFTFYAKDTADETCDKFNVYIYFTQNPQNKFKMDVYKGNCSEESLTCNSTIDYRMATNNTWTVPDSHDAGECPCQPESMDGQLYINPNYCNDQSEYYYVRVYYDTPTVTVPTCSKFALTASNAR